MNKTRFAARIIAGALASAVLLTGALAAPAQAKDTGWPTSVSAEDDTSTDSPKTRRILG